MTPVADSPVLQYPRIVRRDYHPASARLLHRPAWTSAGRAIMGVASRFSTVTGDAPGENVRQRVGGGDRPN
jgi:hypothetical protein